VAAIASTSFSLRSVAIRRRNYRLAFALGASLLLAGCGTTSILVTAERADQIPATGIEPTVTTLPTDPGTTVSSEPSRNTSIDPIDPGDAMGDDDDNIAEIDPTMIDPDAIDFGDNKPPRPYDDFVLASFTDIEVWLEAEFEPAFGFPFEPLQGNVYAGYPERTDPIPGCGEPVTSYEELQQFVAFYCPTGDFIAYDDGDGLLGDLAKQFGPATISIVLAHEYGHALQQRTGVLRRNLPTVASEQQADCVSGAWAGRAAAGDAPGIPFTDNDVRAGLTSMITVQDPVGRDPNVPGGHGSGFDRVGAFQVGFQEGLARCAQLIDDPLPLTPLEFSQADIATGGNAPFGFEENELFGFLVPDLNLLFDNDFEAQFPNFAQLGLKSVQSAADVNCASPFGLFGLGVELCATTSTVYLNEPIARELYDEFGDFAPGYLLGVAWAEAAQISNGSTLTGEDRQLRNDCLVGAWVQTVTPDPVTRELPTPRDPDRTSSISPNDLTEAIRTAITIGDQTSDTNILGSPFEKIDAFRQGALGGIDVCI
jgi:predicted metalloprotease